jgi:TRAP-type mannitol/chloroaromatic compound transport system permease small subunit
MQILSTWFFLFLFTIFALILLSPAIALSIASFEGIKKSKRNRKPISFKAKLGIALAALYLLGIALLVVGYSHNGLGTF